MESSGSDVLLDAVHVIQNIGALPRTRVSTLANFAMAVAAAVTLSNTNIGGLARSLVGPLTVGETMETFLFASHLELRCDDITKPHVDFLFPIIFSMMARKPSFLSGISCISLGCHSR